MQVMNSRLRIILACTLGALVVISYKLYLHTSNMDFFIALSSQTGITTGKHLLLDYFLFMPWPVINHWVIYNIYPHELESEAVPWLVLLNSLYFFFGALLAVALSGEQRKGTIVLAALYWKDTPIHSWVFYTFLTLAAHFTLIGSAVAYYTGPGGPIWVYPSPFFLIPFAIGIGMISFLAQFIYTGLQERGYTKSLFGAILAFIILTGLADVLRSFRLYFGVLIFIMIYLTWAFFVAAKTFSKTSNQ